MSFNESPWMSRPLIPSIGVTSSVAECCNGFISWWTGTESANDEQQETTANLLEPLVVEQATTQVMDEEERLQTIESDLFLDEVESKEASPEHCSDIENALVTNDKEGVHSQLDIFVDDPGQDEIQPNPLMEIGGSLEPLDFDSDSALVTPRDIRKPLRPEVSHDEPAEQCEAHTTETIEQNIFNDTHQVGEAQQIRAPIEKSSSEPLEIENHLLANMQPPATFLFDDDDKEAELANSIFRSRTPKPSTPIVEYDESIHAKRERSDGSKHDEATMSDLSSNRTVVLLPTGTPLVEKRVSGLIAIFESRSTDEGENVTPTSLCSASSFSAQEMSCPCCKKKIYPTDATIAYHDKVFHGGCFKCHLCDRKFSRGMSEVAGMIAADEDDSTSSSCKLSCTKCRDDAAVKHIPLRKSTPACQSITITTPEKGNIQQVKDEIGDDLESVMDGMVPRCAICGTHFLGGGESSDMMILGMNKYHRKCRMYGRPMVERCERKVLPIVAANYAPESLVVRISNTASSESSTQEIMTTFYFILPDKAIDLQRIRSAEQPNENVHFEYVMDSSAYANPNYEGTKKNAKTTFPCHGVGGAESRLSVGFLGDPCGLPIQLADARIEDRDGDQVFCAELECFKFQLRHRFDLVMSTKEEVVDLKTATLSMHIAG